MAVFWGGDREECGGGGLRWLLGLLLLVLLTIDPASAATCTTKSGGNWSVPGRWSFVPGNNGPPANGDVAIVEHVLTLNTSTNMLAGLTVSAGASITDDGASRTINLAGPLVNDGTITVTGGANGRFILGADSQWSGKGKVSVDYLDLASNYRLDFASGTTLLLTLGSTNPLRRVGYNLFNTTANATATLQLTATSAMTLDAAVLRVPNLWLSGGSKTIGSSSQFYLFGTLTVDAGATFNAATNNPQVFAAGDLVLNGGFSSGVGRWTFNGSVPQAISAATSFLNLTLDNPQGLSLGGDLTLGSTWEGNLTLVRGLLTTGGNALLVARMCQGGAWLTRSPGAWVNGRVQLTLPNYSTNCLYPVGDTSNYAPLTLAYGSSGAPTGGTVSASTAIGDHPDTNAYLSGIDAAKSVNRYWTLMPASGTYTNFDVTLQYCAVSGTSDCRANDVDSGATPANFLVAEKVGSAWTTLPSSAPQSNQRKVAGLTGFGDFAIGEAAPMAPKLTKTVSTPTALVGDVVTFTVTASNTFSQALPAFDVTDVLPAGATLTASATSSGTLVTSGQTVVWSLPGLNSGSSAQLTLAVKFATRGVYTNTATSPNSAPARASLTVLPGAITHFRMDEGAGTWKGTANEVVDSGGTGLHGQRVATVSSTATNAIVPVPTIKSQNPSVIGDFCNAGSFDGGGVVRVASNPKFDYTTQLSASVWIYPTAYPSGAGSLYAILSNDRNYEFHLTPTGNLYWWWQASTLTSAARISLNQWTHVAITFNSTAAGRRQIIYINGVPDTVTNNWQGSLSSNPCDFHIGGDVATDSCSLLPARNFRGRIDEAKLYDYELSSAEVQADMQLGRVCSTSAQFDHVRIEHDGAASVCAPETVTLKACADPACSTLYTGNVTTTLTPSGWTGGDTVSFSNGLASRQLARATAGNVTLGAGSTSPIPAGGTRCFKGATETCLLNFAAASCTFDAVEVGAAPKTNIFTKLSDAAFSLDVLAVTAGGAVNTGYTGTVAVDLIDASASACHTNPGLTTASNLTFVSANAGRKPQSFTLGGKAAPSVRVRIQEGAAAPACSSDSFTIRPQGFSAVSSSANADAAGADAAAVPSVKAGAAFTLRADTGKPGYNGLPKVNSGLLEWLGAPGSGRAPPGVGTLAGSTPSGLTFTTAANAGSGDDARGSFTYDEAGYFRFKAFGVYDDSFVAASGDVNKNDCIVGSFSNSMSGGKYGCNFGNTGVSDYFGRFIPDHFDTVVTQACVAGGFTYTGQPIPLTVTARNAGGGIAQNYSDAFSRQLTLTARDLADSVDNPGPGAFANALVAAGSFAGGRATPTPSYAFTSAQTIPTDVRIRVSDGEVSSLRVPAAATIEGVATLRSGRIRLQNTNGSELLPLPVPLQIQYWSGATQGWQLNAADTCTKIEATNFAFSFGGNLSACETRIQVGGAAPSYTATLSAPGAGNSGWADLTLNLGATGSGTQCAVGGGAATAAAPWLQFNWKGSVDNPTARATFGVVRSGPVIHRREVFR